MTYKLYPNIKRMTTVFCAAIIAITLLTLIMRLTFLRDMAVISSGAVIDSPSSKAVVSVEAGDGALAYKMNSRIYFSTPDAKGDVLIENSENNTSYMRVDIVRNDNGKSVYFSGYIAPGTPIKSVRLQGGALSQGVYECTAVITAYDMETKEKLGSEEQPVTIYIGVKPN